MQHSFSRRRRGPGGAERGLRVRGTRAVCERAGAPRLRALQCSAQSRKRIKLGFISLVETPPPSPCGGSGRGQRCLGRSAVYQLLECPLNVHTVPDPCHPQLHKVLLGEGGQVCALYFMVLKLVSVLHQVDAFQPVPDVVLVPQVEGFLHEGPWWVEGVQGRPWRGGRGRGAAPGAHAPHHKTHLLGLVWDGEAGRFEDGGRGQTIGPHGAEGLCPIQSRLHGAGGTSGYRVATARSNCVGGPGAPLGNGAEFS